MRERMYQRLREIKRERQVDITYLHRGRQKQRVMREKEKKGEREAEIDREKEGD